jgi:lipopolysaccharide export system permease protein
MRILDRYIIRQFLLNTLIVSFVLLGLFVLVDFIIDVDEFLKAGRNWATAKHESPTWLQTTGMTLFAIADHYTPMAILLYVYFCGLFVVAGMGFTFAQFTRTRELAAMVTGGISMYRIAMPVIVVGFLIIAVSLPVQEYIVPDLAPKLARSKGQIKHGTLRTFPVHLVPDGQGNLLSAGTFDINQPRPTLTGMSVIERDPHSGVAIRRINAETAEWDSQRHGWHLQQGYVIDVPRPDGVSAAGRSPVAAAGITLGGDIHSIDFYPTAIAPDVLLAKREVIYVRLLSLNDLIRLRSNPAADQPQVAQALWSRFSMLVVNVLILVMALPMFLLREPGNMLLQAGKAAALTVGAWGGALVILQVGSGAGAINPVTAAWLPVVLYLPLSAGLLMTIKT